MNDTFKEIEELLDTTNKSLNLYKDKANRLEVTLGSLDYYKYEFKKLSKEYRNILSLRNKLKEKYIHTDLNKLNYI